MATKNRYARIRKKIENLKDESLAAVAKANRVLAKGIQRLTDGELDSLEEAYAAAVKALRGKATRGDLVSRAQQQLGLLQQAAERLIEHARRTLTVAAKARAELTALAGDAVRGKPVRRRDVARAVKPARDLLRRAGGKVRKATAEQSKAVKKVTAQAVKVAEAPGAAATKAKAARKLAAAKPKRPRPAPGARGGRRAPPRKDVSASPVDSIAAAVAPAPPVDTSETPPSGPPTAPEAN